MYHSGSLFALPQIQIHRHKEMEMMKILSLRDNVNRFANNVFKDKVPPVFIGLEVLFH